jgi:hypothetical protein
VRGRRRRAEPSLPAGGIYERSQTTASADPSTNRARVDERQLDLLDETPISIVEQRFVSVGVAQDRTNRCLPNSPTFGEAQSSSPLRPIQLRH